MDSDSSQGGERPPKVGGGSESTDVAEDAQLQTPQHAASFQDADASIDLDDRFVTDRQRGGADYDPSLLKLAREVSAKARKAMNPSTFLLDELALRGVEYPRIEFTENCLSMLDLIDCLGTPDATDARFASLTFDEENVRYFEMIVETTIAHHQEQIKELMITILTKPKVSADFPGAGSVHPDGGIKFYQTVPSSKGNTKRINDVSEESSPALVKAVREFLLRGGHDNRLGVWTKAAQSTSANPLEAGGNTFASTLASFGVNPGGPGRETIGPTDLQAAFLPNTLTTEALQQAAAKLKRQAATHKPANEQGVVVYSFDEDESTTMLLRAKIQLKVANSVVEVCKSLLTILRPTNQHKVRSLLTKYTSEAKKQK